MELKPDTAFGTYEEGKNINRTFMELKPFRNFTLFRG